MLFVNRKEELKILTKALQSDKFELIVVYGRRRVGKTTLISKAVENSSSIFFTGIDGSKQSNLHRLYQDCSEKFPEINNYKEEYLIILSFIQESCPVLILDEYPYMIKKDPELDSILQTLIDHQFKESSFKLILMGSSIAMMKAITMDPRPLFGRGR